MLIYVTLPGTPIDETPNFFGHSSFVNVKLTINFSAAALVIRQRHFN
jgi:hypothetical protein